jgi:hypothetical protein
MAHPNVGREPALELGPRIRLVPAGLRRWLDPAAAVGVGVVRVGSAVQVVEQPHHQGDRDERHGERRDPDPSRHSQEDEHSRMLARLAASVIGGEAEPRRGTGDVRRGPSYSPRTAGPSCD